MCILYVCNNAATYYIHVTYRQTSIHPSMYIHMYVYSYVCLFVRVNPSHSLSHSICWRSFWSSYCYLFTVNLFASSYKSIKDFSRQQQIEIGKHAQPLLYAHKHTHMHTYVYMNVHTCACIYT